MGSMEQVRASFRSVSDERHLQYHEIEALNSADSSVANSRLPPNTCCLAEGESEEEAAKKCKMTVSSKFNPEQCARNTHGQFKKRRGKSVTVLPA